MHAPPPCRRPVLAVTTALLLAAACQGAIDADRGTEAPTVDDTSTSPRPPAGAPPRPGQSPPAGGASPGAGAAPTPATPPGPAPASACAALPPRLFKLSAEQYARTVEALIPGASVDVKGFDQTLPAGDNGFSNDSLRQALPELHVSHLFQSARALARRALAPEAKVVPCEAAKADRACAKALLDGFGARAYRRPLTSAEVDGLLGVFDTESAGADPATGLRQVVTVMLMSPSFLFRSELGQGPGGTLDGYERAALLSYVLTDGPPDATLREAARAGRLSSSAELGVQIRRLLEEPQAARGVARFLREHLGTTDVESAPKDAKTFASWNADLAADMAKEAELVLEEVLWRGPGTLPALFSVGETFVNARLASHYGLPGVTGTSFRKVPLPTGKRAGILPLGAIMATLSHAKDTDPVKRGIYVRERVLCQSLPAAPDDVPAIPPRDGKSTQRDRLAKHSSDPACASCHKLMDPLGLPFEVYDAVGRLRAEDEGRPIDTTGMLTNVAQPGAFRDAIELQALLGRAEETQACFAERLVQYTLGRVVDEADTCSTRGGAVALSSAGGDVKAAIVAVLTDERLLVRR